MIACSIARWSSTLSTIFLLLVFFAMEPPCRLQRRKLAGS
jgi:hypothetical protein